MHTTSHILVKSDSLPNSTSGGYSIVIGYKNSSFLPGEVVLSDREYEKWYIRLMNLAPHSKHTFARARKYKLSRPNKINTEKLNKSIVPKVRNMTPGVGRSPLYVTKDSVWYGMVKLV